MTQYKKRVLDFNVLDCETDEHSPSYGYAVAKWIFESNRFEERVVCGACDHIQSKDYSEDLINGKVKPPIYTGYDWIYPTDDNYDWAIHYSQCEPLISIKGLPRKEIHYSVPKRYN